MQATIAEVIRSLDQGTLQPVFQPIVDLRTGSIPRYEVLARWDHPEHGLVLPSNFISIAETNGLIGELTQQILRKAFRAFAHLPTPTVLAVNVSPIQLRYRTLPTQIRDVAEDENFPLENLTVEITESALVNNLEVATRITRDLRDMGCRLALDDFGAGYSNLGQLQALPFNEIKIDRSLIAPIAQRTAARKVVGMVLGLGQTLGLTTVAEGVETEEQADMLLRMGADLGQGWLFGRPVAQPAIGGPFVPQPRAGQAGGLSAFLGGLHVPPAQLLAHLRAISDNIPAGLCLLDLQSRFVSVNAPFSRVLGIPIEALLGKSVQEVLPSLYPRLEEFIRRAAGREPVFDIHVLHHRRNSSKPGVAYELACLPACDESGEIVGISAIVSRAKQVFAAPPPLPA